MEIENRNYKKELNGNSTTEKCKFEMNSSQDGLNAGMKTAKEKVREVEETLIESIQFEEEGEKRGESNKKQSVSGTHGMTRKV